MDVAIALDGVLVRSKPLFRGFRVAPRVWMEPHGGVILGIRRLDGSFDGIHHKAEVDDVSRPKAKLGSGL